MDNTSNEYTLQGVYNANGFLGTISALQDVYLALYDTDMFPFPYTGSEHIVITDNQISLNFQIKIHAEIVLHPRNYDGSVFEMLSGSSSCAFRQNSLHGGTPIAQFDSSTK